MSGRVSQGHPDHDACGTGFVAHLNRPASHEVVHRALVALERLSHRGGVDADGSSGDGAGLLTAIPQDFMRREAAAIGIELPPSFGLGMMFLPRENSHKLRRSIQALAVESGLQFLGWRAVPTDRSVLGPRALEILPSISQCFLAPGAENDDFEHKLFLFRKRVENEAGDDAYFCSLSSRTVTYKGLLAPWQLPLFYPDLARPDFESSFAIFHQRYSTNTRPAWSLAQPFRFLAHNGEINTIVGNRRWMQAREAEIRCSLNAGSWFHALQKNVSDSASLDNALELLVRQGFSPEAALVTLVPPAFLSDPRVEPEVRSFLESAASEYEAWDGPAALVFSDGRVLGAKLDRNGLRPLRYLRTVDNWLVAGSEAGIADFEEDEIIERQRLGPGEMLLVDLSAGKVLCGSKLLRAISTQRRLHDASLQDSFHLPQVTGFRTVEPVEAPRRIAAALGWSEDQFRLLFQPMLQGQEAVWSMGDDAPLAFLSRMRRTLWDYCKQRFAQVTNPPIDPLREKHVMSLQSRLGPDFVVDSPVLDIRDLQTALQRCAPWAEIDITFDASQGITGGLTTLDRIRDEALCHGKDRAGLILLSDRRVNQDHAALPVLLAVAAVWRTMLETGSFRTPLVVDTGQVIDSHHVALLVAAGASAVHPFLALQLANEQKKNGSDAYCDALNGGLRKVLSRMGISTLASYRNGQMFEVVGPDESVCNYFFPDASHFVHAKSLEELLQDYLENHALAFGAGEVGLKDAGLYRYRKEGELHQASPELLRSVHAHVKKSGPDSYQRIEDLGRDRSPIALRDLLEFVPHSPVDVAEVEPEEAILRRFSTQAMSLGAISPEAHRTLALAMNRLGARSNTGEGGEDPDLYYTDAEAVCRVKQIASARFGVTAEYLVHADEIEIKMAQGSKPGEGGQLPAAKVTPYIARLRHAVPGMALISPPPHHDIYSIEDLAQLIYDLREVNPRARIGVKLVSGAGVGIIAAGVAKAGADVITISGHDGGTGASPLSSIKNTGLPWELGLRDAHHTLIKTGLRARVRLRADGGFKFARDVVMASLLGADEFGFGTAALLAMGCVMARQCHLNTCPVGIATQDEKLRTRFTGNPEMVIAYFRGVAGGVRELLAGLGVRSLDEIAGDTSRLRPRSQENSACIHDLLQPVANGASVERAPSSDQYRLRQQLSDILHREQPARRSFRITNADRSIGAHLSGEILRRFGHPQSNRPSISVDFRGTSGQSFGAFLTSGVQFHLSGEANDYVGKGLSGGVIAISAGEEASFRGDVLAGNTVLYGATSGQLYIAGRAGERFAVRNSGALAVVEGVGDHGCEYMTGGVALILGPTGINLGSGMTGGLLYIVSDGFSEHAYNPDFVRPDDCSEEEEIMLRCVLVRHQRLTGSPRAADLLSSDVLPMLRLQPVKLPCSGGHTWAPIRERLGDVDLLVPELPRLRQSAVTA